MLPIIALAAAVLLAPATEQRRIAVPEVKQGVAVDARSIYAIANNDIIRLDKRSGARLAAWKGDAAHFKHVNSCTVVGAELVCAASNYPELPMAGSVEVFDKRSLKHIRTSSLPPMPGSLTVLDWHDKSWWAVYANYDGRGGEPGRGSKTGFLARMDRDFIVRESWLFPASVLERFAPHHASGASWARDGLLYVSGHDRPEIYALRLPAAGSTLEHAATIPIATRGQAIDWDDSAPRTLWSIDRTDRVLVASEVPPVPE